MVRPQRINLQAIMIPVAMLMVVPMLAGCLTDGATPTECTDGNALFLETISPEGYSTKGANDSDVPVRLDEEVTVRLHDGACPAESYRWEIMDRYTAKRHRGNVEWDDPSHGQDAGGFGLETFETTDKTVDLEFSQVGAYRIFVDLLDENGNDMDHWGKYSFSVEAYHVIEDELPDDGATWSTTFPAFCCPGVSKTLIKSEGPQPVGVEWTARFIVERTGEVIWQGEPSHLQEHAMWKELGWQWNETIRYELEPQADVTPPGLHDYQVEFRIGPTVNRIDDV